jgi:hypothetical protein
VLAVATVGPLAYVLADVDAEAALSAYAQLDLRWLGMAIGLLALQLALYALRMHWILDPATRPAFGKQLAITAIGFMAITFLPMRLGEVARPWLLAREGVTLAEGMGGCGVDRVFDLLAVSALFLAASLAADLPGGRFVFADVDVVAVASRSVALLAIAAMGGLIALLLGGGHIAAVVRRVPRVGAPVADFVARMRTALHGLSRSPRRLIGVTAASVAIWLVSGRSSFPRRPCSCCGRCPRPMPHRLPSHGTCSCSPSRPCPASVSHCVPAFRCATPWPRRAGRRGLGETLPRADADRRCPPGRERPRHAPVARHAGMGHGGAGGAVEVDTSPRMPHPRRHMLNPVRGCPCPAPRSGSWPTPPSPTSSAQPQRRKRRAGTGWC